MLTRDELRKRVKASDRKSETRPKWAVKCLRGSGQMERAAGLQRDDTSLAKLDKLRVFADTFR